jgi:hypothetical protein
MFTLNLSAQDFTLSGTLKDTTNGETIIGATIFTKDGDYGTATNFYGYYSLTLPKGEYTIMFDYVGFEVTEKKINLTENLKMNLEMKPAEQAIEVVEINSTKSTDNIKKIEMSTIKLDIKAIEKIPALLGEADVIKSIQLLPGVTTVGEGATGFNVRGGGIDQNLILLDEAPVFNSSHLFGFFSVFNPDAVKSVKLIKGGIPAQYGGRLSSILDVRMKEGNSKKLSGQGGIGLLFSRFAVEAPIVKNKSSFIIAGRRSYADILAKPFLKDGLEDSKFYFFDLTAKVNYDFSDKDKLYVSGYFGRDVFSQGFGFDWGNATATLRWNHIYSDKLFSNVTAYYSDYDFELGVGNETDGGFKWQGNIVNYSVKPEFIYYANSKNTITFGGQSILYDFKPGNSEFYSENKTFDLSQEDRFGSENALYVGNKQKISKSIVLEYGLRVSAYYFIGKGTEYKYGDADALDESKPLTEEIKYSNGQVIAAYYNPEPRFSMKVDVDSASSVKASYNRTAQNLHLMSNTAAATPLDVYSPSTNNIKPQLADQVALGYFRNFGKDMQWETSVEGYYKYMQNQIGYITNAELQLNDYYEGDLLFGDGRAYGLEFLIRKNGGKLTGWLSYTLSKTELKIDEINNGNYYNARFDKTHVANLILNYAFNDKYEVSANFVYNTGAAFTSVSNSYSIGDVNFSHNPNNVRNNARLPDYHRLDLSFTIHGDKTRKSGGNKLWTGDWVFSAYNVYARKNAFTVYYDPAKSQAIKYSIIATIVPSVTYNFKF